uniref:Uncharacterized protein n=1 Tax=Anopheles melas TaxID=34690 RepID=A0A182TL39_9DIPT
MEQHPGGPGPIRRSPVSMQSRCPVVCEQLENGLSGRNCQFPENFTSPACGELPPGREGRNDGRRVPKTSPSAYHGAPVARRSLDRWKRFASRERDANHQQQQ